MTLKKEKLTDIYSKAGNYEYALIYEMSKVELLPANELVVNENELIEAFLFGPEGQIHIYLENEELVAVQSEGKVTNVSRDCTYGLAKKFKTVGKSITIREFFEPDEDGQMNVVYKQLVSINN